MEKENKTIQTKEDGEPQAPYNSSENKATLTIGTHSIEVHSGGSTLTEIAEVCLWLYQQTKNDVTKKSGTHYG